MIWAAGDVVTAAQLNEQIRDNLEELDLHDHSGGSGSGTAALGGTAGLTRAIFADAAAPAAPTGTLTAVFTTTGTMGIRSSGGTAQYLAASGHEHGITSVQSLTVQNQAGTNITEAVSYDGQIPTTVATVATLGGSGKRSVIIAVAANIQASTGSIRIAINRDATILTTSTFTVSFAGASGESRGYMLTYLDATLASGSYTWRGSFDGSGWRYVMGKTINVREVSVP